MSSMEKAFNRMSKCMDDSTERGEGDHQISPHGCASHAKEALAISWSPLTPSQNNGLKCIVWQKKL